MPPSKASQSGNPDTIGECKDWDFPVYPDSDQTVNMDIASRKRAHNVAFDKENTDSGHVNTARANNNLKKAKVTTTTDHASFDADAESVGDVIVVDLGEDEVSIGDFSDSESVDSAWGRSITVDFGSAATDSSDDESSDSDMDNVMTSDASDSDAEGEFVDLIMTDSADSVATTTTNTDSKVKSPRKTKIILHTNRVNKAEPSAKLGLVGNHIWKKLYRRVEMLVEKTNILEQNGVDLDYYINGSGVNVAELAEAHAHMVCCILSEPWDRKTSYDLAQECLEGAAFINTLVHKIVDARADVKTKELIVKAQVVKSLRHY